MTMVVAINIKLILILYSSRLFQLFAFKNFISTLLMNIFRKYHCGNILRFFHSVIFSFKKKMWYKINAVQAVYYLPFCLLYIHITDEYIIV